MGVFTRINVLGCPFDAVSFSDVTDLIETAVLNGQSLQFCPGSVDFVMKARQDKQFAEDLWAADCVFADGVPIVWAASLLRQPVRGRVAGTDVVWQCAQISADIGCNVAMIGGNYALTERAAARMRKAFPGARLYPLPTPFPLGAKENGVLVEAIRAVDARIVLVALGAPKQERWVRANLEHSGANVGIGVGSAFDIISGDKPRAPKWMAANGFEWLYRMMQEPRRLGKRYLIDDSPFLFHLSRAIVMNTITGKTSKA